MSGYGIGVEIIQRQISNWTDHTSYYTDSMRAKHASDLFGIVKKLIKHDSENRLLEYTGSLSDVSLLAQQLQDNTDWRLDILVENNNYKDALFDVMKDHDYNHIDQSSARNIGKDDLNNGRLGIWTNDTVYDSAISLKMVINSGIANTSCAIIQFKILETN